MKKFVLLSLLALYFFSAFSVNRTVVAPFVEGKGLKGWLLDSIQINDKKTLVYGHFGLGKGWFASGDLDSYIEIPATGKRFKQTDIQGELPKSPEKVTGTGKQLSFIYIFPAIPANTRVINITSDGFDGKSAGWYGVWLTPRTTVFTEKLANLSALEGNWFEKNGNANWLAGFYTTKVFWKDKFWNFNVLETKNNQAVLELTDKFQHKTTLSVTKVSANELEITENQTKYKLINKPVFKSNDLSTFKQQLNSSDSLTVSGFYQVANPVFSKQAAILVRDIFSDNPISYPVKVSDDGLFSIKIPFKQSSKVIFSNELGPQSPLSQVSFMAEPGDKILLAYRNENENAVVFGGDNQRINNELQSFVQLNPYFVTQKKLDEKFKSDLTEFPIWRNTQLNKLKAAYFDWQINNGINMKLHEIIHAAASYGFMADVLLSTTKSKDVDGSVKDILPAITDTAFYNNKNAWFSDDYFRFLRSISFLRKSAMNIGLPERCEFLIKNSPLSESGKNLLQKLSVLSTNSKDQESYNLLNAFLKENKSAIDSIFKANSDLLQNQLVNKMKENTEKYKLPEGIASDYLEVLPLAGILEKGEMLLTPSLLRPLKEEGINVFSDIIYERNALLEKKLIELNKGVLPADVHVNIIPENTKDLTKSITDLFKGKVIYVDFWATWCGPCKGEMPYSKKQRAELKGKNVVFVYLTGTTSPEMTWKKMIADIPGEHIRLTQDQWSTICKQYNVTGIPHYLLIDKKGKVVNEDAPRPSSGSELQTAVQKLL